MKKVIANDWLVVSEYELAGLNKTHKAYHIQQTKRYRQVEMYGNLISHFSLLKYLKHLKGFFFLLSPMEKIVPNKCCCNLNWKEDLYAINAPYIEDRYCAKAWKLLRTYSVCLKFFKPWNSFYYFYYYIYYNIMFVIVRVNGGMEECSHNLSATLFQILLEVTFQRRTLCKYKYSSETHETGSLGK